MFTNRINRLYQSVNNLRDYVTQVREAYQAQVDIDQNKLMKLFTVVTTIFLPLTLIVGWYGMNFTMPEYNLPYAYPVVIIISISIVVSCIVWFKKNKWF
ncbi:CorA family divalent cation transporter [Clostridium saccharobutylicum]|nr:Mg2+ and Co2+ transporter CorA [Clostridium saccharobutylicum]